MRRTAFVVLLVMVLLVGAAPAEPAHAYSLGGHRFNPPTGYWATGALYPSGWVTAALNASNAWTNVTDCDFSWVRNQAAGQAWGNYVTSYNKGADGRPGLTVYSYNGTTIFNLRINLNTYYPFGTTGPSSMWYDVQNVLTHEFGHGLVLGHSGVSTATMYNYTSRGETLKRTLAADDIAGIQALY